MAPQNFDYSKFIADWIPKGTPLGPVTKPKYDFGTGYPDPDSFPIAGLQEALAKAMSEKGRDLILYPHPQGLPELREFVADKLGRERGMTVDPNQVLLTGGSGQGIGLFTQLFTNPGDTLITEDFTYQGTLTIMRNLSANIVGVATDVEGMIPSALDEAITTLNQQGKPPKLIYTIPTFQNPLGTDMSAQRRKDILAVAQKHGIPIYEDDAYEDLRFEGERAPAIHSYDDSGMVVYTGTFSKIIAPGMRMGFLVAPQELMPRINAINWGRPTSQFAALATLYYLRDHMSDHVNELCGIFQSRRDTMLGAIGEFMGSAVTSSNPKGGLYLWLKLPEGADATRVAPIARERGPAYLTGSAFSPTGEGKNYLRLCFGYENNENIRDGIALLKDVFVEEGLLS